jgi:hypothetical protein
MRCESVASLLIDNGMRVVPKGVANLNDNKRNFGGIT